VAAMDKNIKIPLSIFNQIAYVLKRVDTSNCGDDIQNKLEVILQFFYSKKTAMELRNTYAEIVFAEDDDSRAAAKSAYLEQKKTLHRF
jgi:hypothetical protein